MAFANERAHFGVTMFPTDYSIQPVELARAVEERGLDSLFFPEHTHIPASRKTPFPGGGELPKQYSHTHDPFVAFGACAAVTKRIRLGTGICLVIQRDPITLAKEIASLDSLSNGRFVLGIGAGWNREEMSNHGADYAHRWAIVREKILAMKAIWTQDEAEFHGKFVDFDPIWSYPKPVQPAARRYGSARIRSGCSTASPSTADGWMPIGGLGSGNLERLKAGVRSARPRGRRHHARAVRRADVDGSAARPHRAKGSIELIFNVHRKAPTRAPETGSVRGSGRDDEKGLIPPRHFGQLGVNDGIGRRAGTAPMRRRLSRRRSTLRSTHSGAHGLQNARYAVPWNSIGLRGQIRRQFIVRPGESIVTTVRFCCRDFRPSVAVKLSHVESLYTVGGSNVGDRLAEER